MGFPQALGPQRTLGRPQASTLQPHSLAAFEPEVPLGCSRTPQWPGSHPQPPHTPWALALQPRSLGSPQL